MRLGQSAPFGACISSAGDGSIFSTRRRGGAAGRIHRAGTNLNSTGFDWMYGLTWAAASPGGIPPSITPVAGCSFVIIIVEALEILLIEVAVELLVGAHGLVLIVVVVLVLARRLCLRLPAPGRIELPPPRRRGVAVARSAGWVAAARRRRAREATPAAARYMVGAAVTRRVRSFKLLIPHRLVYMEMIYLNSGNGSKVSSSDIFLLLLAVLCGCLLVVAFVRVGVWPWP